ncbi:MAG: hypothetical protein SGPRY_008511, partial [Prymnesium sp.]
MNRPTPRWRCVTLSCACRVLSGSGRAPLFSSRMLKASHLHMASLITCSRQCFGAAVAKLFTWHSYRSGLATALHAANVDDGTVQLMCPESLHVYRSMGTAEHERLVRKAMGAKVDLIQSVNVPTVMGDEGYTALVREIAAPRGSEAQRAYERALATAQQQPAQAAAAALQRPTRPEPATPTTPPSPGTPLLPHRAAARAASRATPLLLDGAGWRL